jgi:hypothetical protein
MRLFNPLLIAIVYLLLQSLSLCEETTVQLVDIGEREVGSVFEEDISLDRFAEGFAVKTIRLSCGCTVAKFMPPTKGAKPTLSVSWKLPTIPGKTEREIVLLGTANDKDHEYKIQLRADVRIKIEFVHQWVSLSPKSELEIEVEIVNRFEFVELDDLAFEIESGTSHAVLKAIPKLDDGHGIEVRELPAKRRLTLQAKEPSVWRAVILKRHEGLLTASWHRGRQEAHQMAQCSVRLVQGGKLAYRVDHASESSKEIVVDIFLRSAGNVNFHNETKVTASGNPLPFEVISASKYGAKLRIHVPDAVKRDMISIEVFGKDFTGKVILE